MAIKKNNSKDAILNAAEEVVLESGAGHMSLDVVAQKAGVSKGGLMYHFPTKKSLLKAMINRFIMQFYSDREKKKAGLAPGAGQLLKASILTVLDPNEKRNRMGLSILAASAHDPDLLDGLRQAQHAHVKEIAQSDMEFEKAAIFSLAADGLMFGELLQISGFTPEQHKRIKQELLRLIDKEAQR